MNRKRKALRWIGVGIFGATFVAGCGDAESPSGESTSPESTSPESTGTRAEPVRVRLLTHGSWATSDGIFDPLLDEGIEVEVISAGDAGELTNSVVLDVEQPQADAVYGIDNTFLGRALAADAFAVREYDTTAIDDDLLARVDTERVVPVDYGDVCVNVDTEWFAQRSLDPPESLDDLLDDSMRGLAVVEDPNLSSPGLAFVLATVARDPDGWETWWEQLVDNDVLVAPGWTEAWEEFSAVSGDRPIVVSYASSPPADIVYSDPPRDDTRIGVVDDACFRQVEYAGVLRNSKHADAAARVVQFLLEERFQADLPLNMFVFPANESVDEPEVFREFALHPTTPILMSADEIEAIRDDTIERWTDIALA